jgi:hypothetical protein
MYGSNMAHGLKSIDRGEPIVSGGA